MKPYRNTERTRKWIRRAFTELLAEKKDITAITVSELAARADISKTTFYYHYDDIYAVAEEFENELIGTLSAELDKLARRVADDGGVMDFNSYTKGIIAFLRENEDSYRMAMGASSPRLFLDKLKTILAKKVAANAYALPFSPEPDRRQVQIRFLIGACVDVVAEYYRGGLKVPFETVTDVILEAIEKLKA